MNIKAVLLLSTALVLFLASWMLPEKTQSLEAAPERIKIALREVGNQLLLKNKDTTSLILPIIQVSPSEYELRFDNSLAVLPNDLVVLVHESFQKANLPKNYMVQVFRCSDKEVAYSYVMNVNEEKTIVPCSGRQLPMDCYNIELRFMESPVATLNTQTVLTVMAAGLLLLFVVQFRSRKDEVPIPMAEEVFIPLGIFKFYPEQNKLIREDIAISLSKKECELLTLFVAQPNEIIKREVLTKKVWEDHGVIVGRSLDTYISKLRKILKEDPSIKISNVHGIGYILELS